MKRKIKKKKFSQNSYIFSIYNLDIVLIVVSQSYFNRI